MINEPILNINNLNVIYETPTGPVVAIRDLSLELGANEALGIIGESGCGKSTLSYTILDYLPPNARRSGSILFHGENLLLKSEKEMQKYRGDRIAMVYQNPYSALNPSLTIGEQLDEVTRVHRGLSRRKAREESITALKDLSLGEAEGIVRRYPHQVSGGIQQRICIAMALLCQPEIMILDEPTTALDVTTEASILDIIGELKERHHMSLIYISHDIGVVNQISDRIAVMYRGEIVELGPQEELFNHPKHPYTRALINCMPRAGMKKENTRLNTIPGYVTRRSADEKGCPFALRCEKRNATCEFLYGMREIEPGHAAACDRAYAVDMWEHHAVAPLMVASTEHSKRPSEFLPKDGVPQPGALKNGLPKYGAYKDEAHQNDTPFSTANDITGAASVPLRQNATCAPLIELKNVYKYYKNRKRTVRALDGVNAKIETHDVLGVVGESGCGKSTMGHLVAGLLSPTKGKLLFEKNDISTTWRERSSDTIRDIQLIFQNPGRSLNPSFSVEQILDRPIKKMLKIRSREKRRTMMVELLKKVDLGEEYLGRPSTRLSGGEKQRIAVARAFVTSPRLIVCDEPTSALDVSVQASVLNLLGELQEQSHTSYMFISHDLNVINYISDHILVMYLGRVCEYGLRDEVVNPPYHPYTEALLSAAPDVDPTHRQKPIRLEGAPPDPSRKIVGCPFANRCHKKIEGLCDTTPPPRKQLSETHYLFCHLSEDHLRGVAHL